MNVWMWTPLKKTVYWLPRFSIASVFHAGGRPAGTPRVRRPGASPGARTSAARARRAVDVAAHGGPGGRHRRHSDAAALGLARAVECTPCASAGGGADGACAARERSRDRARAAPRRGLGAMAGDRGRAHAYGGGGTDGVTRAGPRARRSSWQLALLSPHERLRGHGSIDRLEIEGGPTRPVVGVPMRCRPLGMPAIAGPTPSHASDGTRSTPTSSRWIPRPELHALPRWEWPASRRRSPAGARRAEVSSRGSPAYGT